LYIYTATSPNCLFSLLSFPADKNQKELGNVRQVKLPFVLYWSQVIAA